jgi:hypothetical protein
MQFGERLVQIPIESGFAVKKVANEPFGR